VAGPQACLAGITPVGMFQVPRRIGIVFAYHRKGFLGVRARGDQRPLK